MADNYYFLEQLLAANNRFPVDDGFGIDWIVIEQIHVIDNASIQLGNFAVRVFLTWPYGIEGAAMAEIKHTNPLQYENVYFTGSIENIMGSGSVEYFSGNAQRNFLQGDPLEEAGADDWLNGMGGRDTLVGSGGSDILDGGADEDLLFGDIDMGSQPSSNIAPGDDSLYGGTGNDTLYGGFGNNVLEGGDGYDSAVYLDFQDDGYTSYFVSIDVDLHLATIWGIDQYDGTTYVAATDSLLGIERFVGSQMADTMIASANPNTYSQVRTAFEGAAGNDALIGGLGADELYGGEGDDYLAAGGNQNIDYIADLLAGGVGNDRYSVTAPADLIELWGQGNDTVEADLSWTLGYNIENLVLTAAAGAGSATGNVLANRITGNALANVLDGRGGTDTLVGGLGDDVYILDVLDTVEEAAGGGHDRALVNFSGYYMHAELEDMQLLGVADFSATGNVLDNHIIGNIGNNVLSGWSGVDTLEGGAGNDSYLIGDSRIVVVEAANGGTDTVQLWTSYVMAAEIENLTVVDSGGHTGTGNTKANRMTGTTGNERLQGMDGDDSLYGLTGNDTLSGGNGNDTLRGDAGNDTLNGGTGTDTAVYTGATNITVDLAIVVAQATGQGNDTLVQVESVTTSTGHDILRGNSLDNALNGAAGDDELNGRGGNDILNGGAGFDTLFADNGNDTLIGGNDQDQLRYTGAVALTVNLGLTTAQVTGLGTDVLSGIENIRSGSGADRLTGNSLGNALVGEGGADTLDGRAGADQIIGGAGNDSLTGGSEGDLFIFTTSAGNDVITDFQDNIDALVMGVFSQVTVQDAGADTLLIFGTTQVRLLNFDHLLISAADFLVP